MILPDLSPYSKFATKFNGANLDERLEQIKSRYQKVVDDSEGDNSEYRIAFSNVHKETLETLTISNNNLAIIANQYMEILKMKYPTHNGERDAMSIICLEILSILE